MGRIPLHDEGSIMERLTLRALHDDIGIAPNTPGYGKIFGARSMVALNNKLSNRNAPAIGPDDFAAAAARLGVPVGHIRGVRKVEAPRGAYDDVGRPSILYERHVFSRNTEPPGRFDKTDPLISGGPYGRGGYGAYSVQYDKLFDACGLDPEAAFRACSWGAFQVLGENAVKLGYADAYGMAKTLTTSEAAHLDSFVRYVEAFGLVKAFRACRPGDPASCVPFVSGYNGPGYKQFDYHTKLAAAI